MEATGNAPLAHPFGASGEPASRQLAFIAELVKTAGIDEQPAFSSDRPQHLVLDQLIDHLPVDRVISPYQAVALPPVLSVSVMMAMALASPGSVPNSFL